jgi:hypothetical protein
MTLQRREAVRRSYRPTATRILFIGESPPASGRFFYCRDSGLYRAMLELFQTADPRISSDTFLEKFKECGCYLIDLCDEPVDKLPAAERRQAHVEGERTLSTRISRMNPEVIISLARSIRSNIDTAITTSAWQGAIVDVPYPGRWIHHRRKFIASLLPIAKLALRETTEHK